jgi:hypothetical protein
LLLTGQYDLKINAMKDTLPNNEKSTTNWATRRSIILMVLLFLWNAQQSSIKFSE